MRPLFFYLLGITLLIACTVQKREQQGIPLSQKVDETSGLIYYNGTLITHNDSGGKAKLYVIHPDTGGLLRTVKIKNAENTDWEDITQDDTYIYISDTGNNKGNRKDLVIYKIKKKDFDTKEEVKAEKIKISYKAQKDFSKSNHTTNYDCEALTSVGNKLYLFSKNWGDNQTSVYICPKEKGKYKLEKKVTFPIDCMITGADYNEQTKQFLLTAYNRDYESFIYVLKDFEHHPFDGDIQKINLISDLDYANQIEAITFKNNTTYYFSREASEKELNGIYYDYEQRLFFGEIN